MRIYYLKDSALTELRHAIVANVGRYVSDEPWLGNVFGDRKYLAEARLEIDAWPELKVPSGNELYELENTIAIHSALRHLTPSQASDERLWTWLAHGPFWPYMRARWSVEGQTNPARYILEHYFVADARSLVRHGLARLWWFGNATVVPGVERPYELTAALLKTTDARQSLMERQFWRNRRILTTLLQRIRYWEGQGLDFYAPRERFRRLCKSLNLYGGTLLLDAVDDTGVNMLVDGIAQAEINS